MNWEKLSEREIHRELYKALEKNKRYSKDSIMGYPGSFLDEMVFPKDALPKSSPYWQILWENPNHIGCHTFGKSESGFIGTQEIEKRLLRICAEDIMKAKPDSWDGYVSSGGTEANIQAMWILRNWWINQQARSNNYLKGKNYRQLMLKHIGEISVVCSEDTHYSVYKGCNILNLNFEGLPVDEDTRQIKINILNDYIDDAKASGIKFFIVILNMGTTMFGSVDEIEPIARLLEQKNIQYKIHVDAAFGGFIYPFSNPDNKLNFEFENIVSVTMDAHKMLEAPYGTGVFLSRKGLINNVFTKAASYIVGNDCTVCGSRSGANAVAVWMILKAYGPDSGKEFCSNLCELTDYLCNELNSLGIKFFRDSYMNIVAIKENLSDCLKKKYELVPNSHENPKWWKVVVMKHVTRDMINEFICDIKS